MDVKEEGEISLDDVSSSEETSHSNWLKKEKKLNMDRKYDKRVEVDILPQDAVYGKENRHYSNELHTHDVKVKPPPLDDLSKDGLLPISSEDELTNRFEAIGIPGSSERLLIDVGPKRKRKKKKKKKTGVRALVLDDLESAIEPPIMPTRITGDEVMTSASHYESTEQHKKYSPPSAKLYRSPINHFKTFHHPRAPSPRRRSPQRLTPERSSVITDRYSQHRSFREHLSRRDETQMLLKKVRQFNNKYKETPVRDKFSRAHVLKSNFASYPKENVNSDSYRTYDVEDEEDIDKLRRAALETKLQKNDKNDIEIIKESKTESEDNSSLNYNAGDQDEEDLELRMIALRSAFQKKHRDRVQRGVVGRNKNVDKGDKSPSSDSFLDDLFNDFKELGKESSTTGVDVEDMDLDSDVEREKENQPYSPTDDLIDDKYSDIETLEPANRVPPNSYPNTSRAECNAPVQTYNQEFHLQSNRTAHPESPYLSSNSVHPSTIEKYLETNQFNYNASYIRPVPPVIRALPTSSCAEAPYSPSDTPAFDPELPVCPSELSFADNVTNATSALYPNNSYLSYSMPQPPNNGPNYIPPPIEHNKLSTPPMSSHSTRDPRRAAALSRKVIQPPTQPPKITTLKQPSVKPVQQSQEAVNINSTLHGLFAVNKHKNDNLFEEIKKSLEEYTSEPAYLQGIPPVTKDANKIPTLVNRTLVPAPILKTNKQLQQKLSIKKPDNTVEKTFKNAEMQPVEITYPSNNNPTFKPIKLPSKVRKIQIIDLPIPGFNRVHELNTSGDKALENNGAVDLSKNAEISTTEAEVKKRGRRPKTPTNKKSSAKKSPIKDGSKVSTKSIGRRCKEISKEAENSSEEKKKIDEREAKKPRGRPRSVHRTDKNVEENKKRESIYRIAKGKTLKALETSSNENDKKRRSSADEDEEALRASVIASMHTSGLKKTRDDSADKRKIDTTNDKLSMTSSILSEKSTTSTLTNNSTPKNNVNSMVVNNKSPINRTTITNVSYNLLANTRKRPGTTDIFGPPEKLVKKTTTISKNSLDNLTKNLVAPASPKMSKNVTRVVINLGEDSDSDFDSDHSSLSLSKKSNVTSVSSNDWDKKLDEFLKSQREKLEINSKALSTPTTNKTVASINQKTSALGSTPLAVRHLPVSKQEEYRKLKQQLAEKEKQQKMRASEKKKKSTEDTTQVTATDLQVKKTTKSPKSAATPSSSTSPLFNDQEMFTNISKPLRTSSSLTPAIENLQPLTNIYPNNLIDTSLAEKQQLSTLLDFSIKPDPDDFLLINEDIKTDPLIVGNVSQNCYNEINYDMPLESLAMRENLIIQISNTEGDTMTCQRKVLFANDLTSTEEITPHTPVEKATPSTSTQASTSCTPTSQVLKILTTDQLNMRIEQEPPLTNQDETDTKVRLDETGQVIPVTQNIQPPIQNAVENNDAANNLVNQVPLVVPKPEPAFNSAEQHMSITSEQVTSATESSAIKPTESVQVNINTEELAHLLPPKKEPEVETLAQSETVTFMTPTNIIKAEVEESFETYSKLPIEEQKIELSKIENNLVKKRYNVLSDVTEMIESLQRWEMEQNAKIQLATDVARLRLELKMAEERFEKQKFKVNNMGPKIKKAHSTINIGRSECVKLTQLCQNLGANVSGDEYKIPTVGADVLTNKLKDIANYTQQLFKKREAFNHQKNNTAWIPPDAHKNHIELPGVGKPNQSEPQSVPLNLSVPTASQINENLPPFKTEKPENQNSNSTPTTTSSLNANSTIAASSTTIITFSSVTDFTSNSNNNPTIPVQSDLSVNINQNQEISNEFSLSKVKAEPTDVNETENIENIPMEVDTENNIIIDTQSSQIVEPIAQIKTERIDDEGINEIISIPSNTTVKEEKVDSQSEENSENTLNNISIRVIPSERLIDQRMEEEKTNEENLHITVTQQTHAVVVNNETVGLNINVSSNVDEREKPEAEKILENNQIQNTEIQSVSDILQLNGLTNDQTRITDIKSETDPVISSNLEENDVNIVGQASDRSAEAVVSNTHETWADFEEKPSVPGVSYESVLTAFNTSRPVDPNGVLCPFELMGTCKDDSCTYNHLNDDRNT